MSIFSILICSMLFAAVAANLMPVHPEERIVFENNTIRNGNNA